MIGVLYAVPLSTAGPHAQFSPPPFLVSGGEHVSIHERARLSCLASAHHLDASCW